MRHASCPERLRLPSRAESSEPAATLRLFAVNAPPPFVLALQNCQKTRSRMCSHVTCSPRGFCQQRFLPNSPLTESSGTVRARNKRPRAWNVRYRCEGIQISTQTTVQRVYTSYVFADAPGRPDIRRLRVQQVQAVRL